MSEQTKNILWMAEELDFTINTNDQLQAAALIDRTLENVAGSGLVHSVYPA